jgi:SAM-dependent methyltransferase
LNDFVEYREWKNWTSQGFGKCTSADSEYFTAEFAEAGVELSSPLSILEIGFGSGNLAQWAGARGWNYVGIELDPELVALGRAAGFDVYDADPSLKSVAPERCFDIIVAFDVLEHLTIQQIVQTLKAARDRLNTGGRFIARFPSGDSPFSRAIQHGDLTHQSVIGTGIVQQLSARSGFQSLQIRAPAFPIWGLGFKRALRRAAVRGTRLLLGACLRLIYYDNTPRVIEPNMLIVLTPYFPETGGGE